VPGSEAILLCKNCQISPFIIREVDPDPESHITDPSKKKIIKNIIKIILVDPEH
jgi:hypothetical protein